MEVRHSLILNASGKVLGRKGKEGIVEVKVNVTLHAFYPVRGNQIDW